MNDQENAVLEEVKETKKDKKDKKDKKQNKKVVKQQVVVKFREKEPKLE